MAFAKVTALVPAGQPGTPAKVVYKPTAGDWQLLEAFQAQIATTGRVSNDAIGNHLKVSGEAIRKRLNKPGCRAWIHEHLELGVAAAWPAVLARAFALAMRGSIDHMNFLAKCGGKFQQLDAGPTGDHSGPTYVFNSLIPRR